MKPKILAALAFSVLFIAAKANHFSALNLKMFDNGNFSVVLDNQPSGTSNLFSAQRILPGYHHLQVFRCIAAPYGCSLMRKEMYNGWITVPPKSILYAQIDAGGQFDVMKMSPAYASNGWGDYDDCNGYGYGNNYGYDYNESGCNGNYEPQMPAYMPQQQFMQLKESLACKSFESSKLEMAKQAIAGNYFSAAEVADLLSVFSFESSKLDVAKYAYQKTFDKQNYYLVDNAFSFESSITELNQYIAGR